MYEYGRQPFHIAAYTFAAEINCPDCIAEWAESELIEEGFTKGDIELIIRNEPVEYDAGVYGFRSETLLAKLAKLWSINLEDSYTWDSDDFPKIIFADQIEDKEYCGICHEVIT